MNPIRFGLIGFGAWGSHHARAIQKTAGAELTAIAAQSAETRRAAQAAHPKAAVYDRYQALVERPDIDVIDLVLPSHLHHEIGKAALQSGKHLLLEKPMALTLAHCNELAALAEDVDRILAIGHEMRLASLWGKVKELIDGDAIGTPLYLLVELWRRPYRQGAGGWRYDLSRVGNWILEEPIHFFDLARWYLSAVGEPASVYARANSRQPGHPELRDNFSAVLNFPEGVYAVISQTLCAFEHHQVVKVAGTKGSLWATWSGALDRDLHPTYGLKYHDGQTVAEIPLARPTGEVYELDDEIAMMVRAVRDGGPVAASASDGKWSVALCLAAQRSVDTGAVISIPEFLKGTAR
jgi:myo-inositol 2-dehydrogenase/D-chiro-inositol 1-dehydrogenase